MSPEEACVDHGRIGSNGYLSARYQGCTTSAHRVAYCKYHGIPLASIQDRVIRHKCDNRRCINPYHLEIGSQSDNMVDKALRTERNFTNLKLTPAEAYRIKFGGESAALLASALPVSRDMINKIRRGVKWAHLKENE